MNKLYEYKKQLPHTPHGRGKEETHIVDAERDFIESYISRDDFRRLFGGYVVTMDIDDPENFLKYLGVWGKDKVRKLRRILRERGAQFEVCQIDGSQRFIKITSQGWGYPEDGERET